MPRIELKPNSPEYADATAKPAEKHCDMPGCTAMGDHKAPKSRDLKQHYWFCLEHVREYNQAWDYFSGMPPQEVEEHLHKSLYGDRPTWRYAGDGKAQEALHRAAWKTYHFTDKEPEEQPRSKPMEQTTPEFQAMAVMGLKPPVTLDEIKARYKTLAKKHHPDLNKGDPKSEELLKQINMAYTILKLAYEEYRKLPDHKF